MVEISGSFIRKIFSAGIDFVKTIQEKGVRKGLQQFGPKFLDLCKTVSTNMSNSFSSISRSVKASSKSFFPKPPIVFNGQKRIEYHANKLENSLVANRSLQSKTKDSLINESIKELREMGLKEGRIYKSGTIRLKFTPSTIEDTNKKEDYVKSFLLNKCKETGKVSKAEYDILKSQSLEEVSDFLKKKPNIDDLKRVLEDANFSKTEIDAIKERIDSHTEDKDIKILKFYFFVKKRKGKDSYKNYSTDVLKKGMYFEDDMRELSNRWNIQEELDKLFPKS